MVKKLSKCVLLNKVKTSMDDPIHVVKYGHARNLLNKKKECLVVDRSLNANEIANKKIYVHIKNDLERAKDTKGLEIIVKANKSGTLYEALTHAKVMHILKTKRRINNLGIFSAKMETTDGSQIQEIKSIGEYKLTLSHAQEEIVCIPLKVIIAVVAA